MLKKIKNFDWRAKLLPHKWWQWVVYVLVALAALMYTARWWNPIVFPPIKDPEFGVSFSIKQAQIFGLDWKQNYLALLNDMGIKHYRLMSYWDLYETSPGKYDFSSLDWQIDQAAKHHADVTLAIGLRQPRWPECHQPDWAVKLKGSDYLKWKQSLEKYISVVVKRYENNPAVISWQLENEALNNWFGECGPAQRQRIIEEYKLVKSISQKPVWMSLSDEHGLPVGQPWPDKFGFSVYRTVWNEKIGPVKGYITYPTPIWYHNLRREVIKLYSGRDSFIHELQLEPWGPVGTVHMSVDEQNKSMDLRQIHDSLLFGRELGMKQIYLWGGEWWYWRKVNGDASVWDTVKSELYKADGDTGQLL